MKPTKAQKIASLEIARGRIESEEECYICWALEGTPADEHLCYYIIKALGVSCTYSGWLYNNHLSFYKAVQDSDPRFKEGRIQYIDWMIANAT